MLDEEALLKRAEHIANNGAFGCEGRHHGPGSPECPRHLHHHHDMFCDQPTALERELANAPVEWDSDSRA